MDLRDLETFVVVAEELHFGRAAQRLHIVPAAVTQRIRALEEDFGVQLFHRTSRRVELTLEGLRLVEATKESLRAVEELRDLALELSGRVAARLSIAVGPDLGAFLAPVLAALSTVVPDLRPTGVSMWSSEASAAVQEGAVDGAIVRAPVLRSGIEESPIGTSIDTAVAVSEADPISRLRTPITREDLRDRSVLIPDRAVAPGPHDQIVEYFADAGWSRGGGSTGCRATSCCFRSWPSVERSCSSTTTSRPLLRPASSSGRSRTREHAARSSW